LLVTSGKGKLNPRDTEHRENRFDEGQRGNQDRVSRGESYRNLFPLRENGVIEVATLRSTSFPSVIMPIPKTVLAEGLGRTSLNRQ